MEKTTYYRCMEVSRNDTIELYLLTVCLNKEKKKNFFNNNQLPALDEIDDQSVLNMYKNRPEANGQSKTTNFHFSLKNKIGGLARALRVFQVKKKLIFLKKMTELQTFFGKLTILRKCSKMALIFVTSSLNAVNMMIQSTRFMLT